MLSWIISQSLRQRVLVLALALLLVLAGVRAGSGMATDVFPEFAPPLVEVQTEAPGLSTEEVESLVTLPLELGVNGVPGLVTLRSKSVLGLSSLVMIFAEGSDVIRARQLVQERVAIVAAQLPVNVRAPVLLPPLSATSRVMKIGLSSTTLDRLALSDLVRRSIKPRLMAVPGVANVAVWGQRDRQLQVLVDPDRLRQMGVPLAEVERATAAAASRIGGGFVDTPNQRLPVRHLPTLEAPADLAAALLRVAGTAPIRIGDVASVGFGHAAPIGEGIVNDGPGLLLIVEKQLGANTLAVSHEVERALDELAPALDGVEVDRRIFRPATFIERSLANLQQAMVLGCLLVALVLITFTRNWRAALISLTAIPLSVLSAVLVMSWLGYSLNIMLIAGLVIALGEVVDDAIVDVENIGRRLHLNRMAAAPRPLLSVVLDASLEVRGAVVCASLIVMLVFVPLFFLDGVSGSFFRPLAIAYVLAIGGSLLVALTVTPALCLLLLPRGVGDAPTEAAWVSGLKRRYRRLLPQLLHRPRLAVGVIAGGVLLGAAAGSNLREQFLPDFHETDFLMHFVEKPGTSLDAMSRIAQGASRELRSIPGVRSFGAHIGRAEAGDEVYGPHFTELWISLDEQADYAASVRRIQALIDSYPGLYRDVLTYLRERIKEVLSGSGATLVVRIHGPDLEGLRASAAQVKAAIEGVPGVTDLKIEQQTLIPQIQIRARPQALAAYGLSDGDLRRAASTLIQGSRLGEIYREQLPVDVVVWSEPEQRQDLHALQDLLITTATGAQPRLGELAELRIAPAANEIRRENGSRRIDVTMNLAGGDSDLGAAAREVERRVRALHFPSGFYPRFLGEYQALQQSRQRLLSLGLLSLGGVLLLVWLEFRSLRLTLLVAASLPFAAVGGVFAIVLGGGVMSLGALVGFVTVLGITARNALMLLSHYRHMQEHEHLALDAALVLRGAEERLLPILMTASCAGLALLPLLLRGDAPGHEIEHPMALVIVGGLLSSTALTLLLMPSLYLRFGRSAERAP